MTCHNIGNIPVSFARADGPIMIYNVISTEEIITGITESFNVQNDYVINVLECSMLTVNNTQTINIGKINEYHIGGVIFVPPTANDVNISVVINGQQVNKYYGNWLMICLKIDEPLIIQTNNNVNILTYNFFIRNEILFTYDTFNNMVQTCINDKMLHGTNAIDVELKLEEIENEIMKLENEREIYKMLLLKHESKTQCENLNTMTKVPLIKNNNKKHCIVLKNFYPNLDKNSLCKEDLIMINNLFTNNQQKFIMINDIERIMVSNDDIKTCPIYDDQTIDENIFIDDNIEKYINMTENTLFEKTQINFNHPSYSITYVNPICYGRIHYKLLDIHFTLVKKKITLLIEQ